MKNQRIAWTSDKIKILKELHQSTPNKEIARLTGWSYGAIINQAKFLKLKKDPTLKFKIREKELQILTTPDALVGFLL